MGRYTNINPKLLRRLLKLKAQKLDREFWALQRKANEVPAWERRTYEKLAKRKLRQWGKLNEKLKKLEQQGL